MPRRLPYGTCLVVGLDVTATAMGGRQGAPGNHPPTIHQDGPDSLDPRAVEPLGHGVAETQRDRAASAQPPPHAAQEKVVAWKWPVDIA